MADPARWLTAIERVLRLSADLGTSCGASPVPMCGPNGGPVWGGPAEPQIFIDAETAEDLPPLTWVVDADGVLLTSNSILRLGKGYFAHPGRGASQGDGAEARGRRSPAGVDVWRTVP
jgi:hypothetical protein